MQGKPKAQHSSLLIREAAKLSFRLPHGGLACLLGAYKISKLINGQRRLGPPAWLISLCFVVSLLKLKTSKIVCDMSA